VKRLAALLVTGVFVVGVSAPAVAQTQTPAPAPEKKADKAAEKAEKPSDKAAKAAEKKPATRNANGVVRSAGADSVVVAGKEKGKDAEWTFAVDPKTKIKKGGKDITAKDLAAGDNVHVRYMDHEGKAMAMAITVRPAKRAEAATKKDEKKDDKK
jgi:hypothetical protein